MRSQIIEKLLQAKFVESTDPQQTDDHYRVRDNLTISTISAKTAVVCEARGEQFILSQPMTYREAIDEVNVKLFRIDSEAWDYFNSRHLQEIGIENPMLEMESKDDNRIREIHSHLNFVSRAMHYFKEEMLSLEASYNKAREE
jgi:hypothetical protein